MNYEDILIQPILSEEATCARQNEASSWKTWQNIQLQESDS